MHLAKGVRKLYKGAFYPFGDFLMRILSALSLSLTLGCTGPQLRPLVEGENDTGSSGEDTAQVEDTSDTGAVDTGRPLDSGDTGTPPDTGDTDTGDTGDTLSLIHI